MLRLSYPGERPTSLTTTSSALKLVVTDTGPDPEPLEPSKADISKHLYALFAPAFVKPYPEAWIEIAYSDAVTGSLNAAETFSVFDLKRAAEFAEIKSRAGCNVYVGPAIRQGERPASGRANDEHALTSSYAWAEYDGAGDDERVQAVLKERNLKPALIVTTGTVPCPRRHLYFKLDGIVTPEKLRAANTSLKRLLDSDDVENPSRIMRLAGRINHPTPKKRRERGYTDEQVTIHYSPEACAYLADDLIELAGEPPKSSHDGASTKTSRTDNDLWALLETSREPGKWHNSIRDATASMVGKDWSDLQIKLACASYCNEKYGDLELDELIQSARKKWSKPDFADTTQETPERDKWPELDDAAYHGLAGEIVRLLEPHTEADPVGILIQVLATFGNIIGNSPHYLVESDKHRANLFAVLVGTSSKGRKGTSGGRVRAITKDADEFWAIERCASGLSSGEGIINAVRDEIKKWNAKERCEETIDPGIKDKRLMVMEPEFAGTLAVMERPGNTLSPVIRNAWDGQRLQTLAKSAGQV